MTVMPGAVADTRPRSEAIIPPPPARASAREVCAWQTATASASAAWSEAGGRSSRSDATTIRCTCVLSARPKPHTVIFTSAGGYPVVGSPERPQAVSTAPRAWPTERIVRGLPPTNRSSSATEAGSWRAIRADTSA